MGSFLSLEAPQHVMAYRRDREIIPKAVHVCLDTLFGKHTYGFIPVVLGVLWLFSLQFIFTLVPALFPTVISFFPLFFLLWAHELPPLQLLHSENLSFLWLYLCLLLSTPKQLVLAILKPCFLLLNKSKCTRAFKSFQKAFVLLTRG